MVNSNDEKNLIVTFNIRLVVPKTPKDNKTPARAAKIVLKQLVPRTTLIIEEGRPVYV